MYMNPYNHPYNTGIYNHTPTLHCTQNISDITLLFTCTYKEHHSSFIAKNSIRLQYR